MSLPVEQNPKMMSQNEKDLEKKKLDEVAEELQDLLKRQVFHVVMHGWEKAFFVRFKTLTGKIKVGKIGLTITFDIIRTLIQNEEGIPPVQQRLNYKGRDVHNMDSPRSLGFCSDADAGEAELIHIVLRLGCDGGLRRNGCRGRCDDCFTRMPEVSRKNTFDLGMMRMAL